MEKKTKERKLEINRLSVLFLILCWGIMIFGGIYFISQKEGFFLDEYSSYGCANGLGGKKIRYETNVAYTAEEVEQMALGTYTVTGDRRFNYVNVWNNLSINVHPPIFYALLHTVSSLTPGIFSKWQAFIINLFFGFISILFFQKLARTFVRSEWLSGVLCVSWVCTVGYFSSLTLLRDYMAALCGCIITLWEIYRYLHGNRNVADLIKIAAATVLGMLSHYYSAIYIFFLCAVVGMFLLVKKDFKDFGKLFAGEVCALVVSFLIFPSLVHGMFFSSRGSQATENIVSADASSFINGLREICGAINNYYFGHLIIFIVPLVIILIVLFFALDKSGKLRDIDGSIVDLQIIDILLLVVPSAFYILLVSKVSSMHVLRYMFPASFAIYLSVFAVVGYFLQKLFDAKMLVVIMSICLIIMSAMTWKNASIKYLYKGMNDEIANTLEPYAGLDAIQLWNKTPALMGVTMPEYKYFNTITFMFKVPDEDLENIEALREGNDMIVIVADNAMEYLDKLQQIYPEYQVESLGCLDWQNRFITYYFHVD